jgi:RNA polymerase sigma-70 factor (ECF subfamily)
MSDWRVGTEAEFLTFYEATVRDAHRYAARLVGADRARAEDLVQDAYMSLLRRAKAGTLTEVGAGWLVLAIRHRFLDTMRGAEREQRRLRLVWSSTSIDSSDVSGDPLAGSALTDRERAALTLRYVDDLSVADVAAAVGSTVRATESLLARARARVRSEVRDA